MTACPKKSSEKTWEKLKFTPQAYPWQKEPPAIKISNKKPWGRGSI